MPKIQSMTNEQLAMHAFNTCKWWNATFIQANRFLDAFEQIHGDTPWIENEKCSIYTADRLFLIIAIHHAIDDLLTLNEVLQQRGDCSIQKIIDAIADEGLLQDIHNLRNMNEHDIEYLVGAGRNQEQFFSSVQKDNYSVMTVATGTVAHGDAGMFLLGNVKIDRLLIDMKAQLPAVQEKTKEIFDKMF